MSNERIFLVEDEPIIAQDLRRRLEYLGYSVVGSSDNTDQALSAIKRSKPDVVLMDIVVPGSMDGIDLAIKIRWEENIPSIFLTAYTDEALVERAKEAEPLGYLLKPIRDRELATVIEVSLYKNFAETKIRKNEELFSAILNSTSDAIIALDRASKIVFINPEAETLLGISDLEARDRALENLLTLSDLETGESFPVPGYSREQTALRPGKLRLSNRIGKTYVVEMSVTHDAGEHNHAILSFRDISRLHEISDDLKYQTTHDQLTGLLNRNEFALRMTEALRGSGHDGGFDHAVFVDIDHFKLINDACGTDAGDALLVKTAQLLRRVCGSRGFASRLGGDDFVVVTQGNPEKAVRELLETLRAEAFEWMGKTYPITLSAGIVSLAKNFRSEHELMLAGTNLVHQVHASGGNRYEFLEDGQANHSAITVSEWISLIHEALHKNQFRLYYQPIEPLSERAGDAKIEILIRIRRTDGAILMPGEFVHIAERYGVMPQVDRWVIDRAFAAWKRLTVEKNPLAARIFSLNLSGASLVDESIISFIVEKAEEHLIDPARFCIEITETNAIHNLTSASRFIYILKERGFKFALDDFGSGFSSFNYLKNLPVDYLKIDGSFIRNMDRDPIDFTMVEAMSSMGRILGLETIGEYAKNGEIIGMLRNIGVDYAQGYGIAEPRPLP